MSLSILSKNFKATISIDKQTEFITISLKGWPPTLAFISNIGVDRWSIRAIPKVNQVIKWNCCYCTLWREHNKHNKLDHADKTDQLTDGIILDLRCLNCEEGEEVKKSTPSPPAPKKKKIGLTCKQTLALCGNAVKLFSLLSKRALNVLFLKEVRLW